MSFGRIGTIFFNLIAGLSVGLTISEESAAWGALALVAALAQFYPDIVLNEMDEIVEDEDDKTPTPKE